MGTDPILHATATTTQEEIVRAAHVHCKGADGNEFCYKRRRSDLPCPFEDPAPAAAEEQVRSEEARQMMLRQMEVIEDFKRTIAAMVAGLVADGFTDREARDIVAGFWRNMNQQETPDA